MTPFDLVVTNAVLPDGRDRMTVACRDGRIAAVERDLQAAAGRTIDAQGELLSPPFVDAHFHLDSALTYGAVSGYGKVDGLFSWLSGKAVLRTASRSSARVSLPSARKTLPGIAFPSATTWPDRWPTFGSPIAWRTRVRTVPKMPAV